MTDPVPIGIRIGDLVARGMRYPGYEWAIPEDLDIVVLRGCCWSETRVVVRARVRHPITVALPLDNLRLALWDFAPAALLRMG